MSLFGSRAPSCSPSRRSRSASRARAGPADSTPRSRPRGSRRCSTSRPRTALSERQKRRVVQRAGPVLRAVAQDERSQLRNREHAIERLVEKLGRRSPCRGAACRRRRPRRRANGVSLRSGGAARSSAAGVPRRMNERRPRTAGPRERRPAAICAGGVTSSCGWPVCSQMAARSGSQCQSTTSDPASSAHAAIRKWEMLWRWAPGAASASSLCTSRARPVARSRSGSQCSCPQSLVQSRTYASPSAGPVRTSSATGTQVASSLRRRRSTKRHDRSPASGRRRPDQTELSAR